MEYFYIIDESTLNKCDRYISNYFNDFLVMKREFYLDEQLNLCHLDHQGRKRLIAIPSPTAVLDGKMSVDEPLFIVKVDQITEGYQLTEAFKLQTHLDKQRFKAEFF